MGNTGTITFTGGLKVYVQALSNAAYTQTITITPPSGTADVFSGSGEGNVAMALTQQGFLQSPSPGGQSYFIVPGNSSQNTTYKIAASNNGPNNSSLVVNLSTYSTPAQGTLIVGTAASEDSGDNDYNDSLAIFTAWVLPS